MQARWLTQLIVKNKHLPTKSEMILEIEKDQVGFFFLRISPFLIKSLIKFRIKEKNNETI